MECLSTALPDIIEAIFPGASGIGEHILLIGKVAAIVIGTLLAGTLLFAFASLGASRRLNAERRGIYTGTHR